MWLNGSRVGGRKHVFLSLHLRIAQVLFIIDFKREKANEMTDSNCESKIEKRTKNKREIAWLIFHGQLKCTKFRLKHTRMEY